MKNRIKKYLKKEEITNIDEMLKEIEAKHNLLMSSSFMRVNDNTEIWAIELQKILSYEKYKKGGIKPKSSQEVSDLIDAINSVYKILKDPDAPEPTKAILEDMHLRTLGLLCGLVNDPYIKELFDRRNETPKDNPVMITFLDNMLGHIVFDRFYKAEFDKVNYDDMTEKEQDEYGKMTPEAGEKYNKEFTEVYEEYGIEAPITIHKEKAGDYISLKPAFSFLDKLPENYKKERKKEDAEFMKQIDKEINKEGATPTS